MSWSDFQLRLRALLFRQTVEDELDEELRFHVAMETRKNLETGMRPADARRKVNVQFGGLEQVKEECRDVRGLRFIETISQDVRYALSGFRRTPGFASTVVATIALGLGLNTTLFTIFNAYVLQPLRSAIPTACINSHGPIGTWRGTGSPGTSFRTSKSKIRPSPKCPPSTAFPLRGWKVT
jgi:hypothetical protein